MKNERHWQEQLIEIPLCDYEDLLIDRLELQERKKREKEIKGRKKETSQETSKETSKET